MATLEFIPLKKDQCCQCTKRPKWYRHTQFFGNFLYCLMHAEKAFNFPHAWAGWNKISS